MLIYTLLLVFLIISLVRVYLRRGWRWLMERIAGARTTTEATFSKKSQ
jgi:hypothetical protein